MSVNLEDWRRIDVEQYDPEFQYEEDPIPGARPDLSTGDMANLEQSLRQAIQKGSTLEGLKAIFPYIPYGATEDVKDAYLHMTFEALTSGRVNDIATIVPQLNLDEVDNVIKFCYTLMKKDWAMKQAGVLLIWIDKIVEKFGDGPIVRYISDPAQL